MLPLAFNYQFIEYQCQQFNKRQNQQVIDVYLQETQTNY